MNMSVNVPAAVSHRLPIGHGVMAHHDFHAVDFQYLDWRFYDKRVGDFGLAPVFIVIAVHEVDFLAANEFPQFIGLLHGELE